MFTKGPIHPSIHPSSHYVREAIQGLRCSCFLHFFLLPMLLLLLLLLPGRPALPLWLLTRFTSHFTGPSGPSGPCGPLLQCGCQPALAAPSAQKGIICFPHLKCVHHISRSSLLKQMQLRSIDGSCLRLTWYKRTIKNLTSHSVCSLKFYCGQC